MDRKPDYVQVGDGFGNHPFEGLLRKACDHAVELAKILLDKGSVRNPHHRILKEIIQEVEARKHAHGKHAPEPMNIIAMWTMIGSIDATVKAIKGNWDMAERLRPVKQGVPVWQVEVRRRYKALTEMLDGVTDDP